MQIKHRSSLSDYYEHLFIYLFLNTNDSSNSSATIRIHNKDH